MLPPLEPISEPVLLRFGDRVRARGTDFAGDVVGFRVERPDRVAARVLPPTLTDGARLGRWIAFEDLELLEAAA